MCLKSVPASALKARVRAKVVADASEEVRSTAHGTGRARVPDRRQWQRADKGLNRRKRRYRKARVSAASGGGEAANGTLAAW